MDKLIYQLFEANELTINWWGMSFRAALIFIFGVLLIRLGGKRIFGQHSTFDIILSIILGAILSKVIAGSSKFFPSLGACVTLAVMHKIFSVMTLKSKALGKIIKGETDNLIDNGIINEKRLRENNISPEDLLESVRINGGLANIEKVKAAFLERNGKISIIKDEQ